MGVKSPKARPPHPWAERDPWRAFRRWLWAVGGVALLYRTAYGLSVRSNPLFAQPVIDAAQNHAWAVRIANGCVLGSGPDDVFKPPLYPAFVGLLYALVGPNVGAVQIGQSLLGVLSCLLTALLGACLFGPFVGVIAGLFSALYAPYLFFEGQLLSPALSICLNLAIVLLGLAIGRRGPLAWAGWGALTGVAIGVRPDALLGLGAFLIHRLVRFSQSETTGTVWKRGGGLGAGLLLTLTPVGVRNYALTHSFIFVSSNAGINFYTGNGLEADGISAIPPGLAWSRTLSKVPEAILLRPAEASRWWFSYTCSDIRQDVFRWVRLLARKAFAFWNGREFRNNIGYDWFRSGCPLLKFPFLQYWPVAALGLAGLGLCCRRARQRPDSLALVLVLGGYFVAGVGFFVAARFRMPAVPFMMVLAALAVERVRDLAGSSIRAAIKLALILAACLVATWPGWFPLSPQMESQDWVNLGNVYREKGDLDSAFQAYQQAARRDPQNADALFLSGQIRLQQGRPAEALEYLDRAFTLCPDGVNILLNMAEAYRLLGRPEEALERYAALFRLTQTGNWSHEKTALAKAHLGRGELWAVQGREAEAKREFEQAWTLSEQTAAEYALLKGEELERAREAFRRLVDREPWNWYHRANLGMTFLKQGQFAEAARELEMAARCSEARPGVRFFLGLALWRAGQPKEAENILTHLLAELPECQMAEDVRRVLNNIQGDLGTGMPVP